MKWIENVVRWLRGGSHPPAKGEDPSDQLVEIMMRSLQRTREDELSCEEAYRLLDEYADQVADGRDAGKILPLVRLHLELCPDCHEEYEALMRALKASPDLN